MSQKLREENLTKRGRGRDAKLQNIQELIKPGECPQNLATRKALGRFSGVMRVGAIL